MAKTKASNNSLIGTTACVNVVRGDFCTTDNINNRRLYETHDQLEHFRTALARKEVLE